MIAPFQTACYELNFPFSLHAPYSQQVCNIARILYRGPMDKGKVSESLQTSNMNNVMVNAVGCK